MKVVFLGFLFAFISFASFGQADRFFPESGTVLTYNSYNAKGKLDKNGWVTETFSEPEKKGDATIIRFSVDWKNKEKDMKDAPAGYKDLFDNWEFRIQNDTVYMDFIGSMMAKLTSMMQSQLAGQPGTSVTVTGSGKVVFPRSLKAGMSLPDTEPLKTTTKISAQGMSFESSITVRYYDGKVEAEETVTTPAGTFQCYKISQFFEQVQDMIMTKNVFREKDVSWLSPGIGVVKTERYDEKGNLQGIQVLDKIEKK